MSWFQLLLVLLFYCLIGMFYWYSKGKFNVKDEKKEKYAEWVNKYGSKASKACVKLLIIYTVILIFQLMS